MCADHRPALFVRQRRPLGHAPRAALRGTLDTLGRPLPRRVGLGFLEVGFQRPLADACQAPDKLQELVFLGGVDVGREQHRRVDRRRLLAGLLQHEPGAVGRVQQPEGPATVGEAVDDDGAVVVDEHAGLAGAIVDAVERVRQRLVGVALGRHHHVVDGGRPERVVVEQQREGARQRLLGQRRLQDARPVRAELGPFGGDPPLLRSLRFRLQRRAGRPDQPAEFGFLRRAEVRHGGTAVERIDRRRRDGEPLLNVLGERRHHDGSTFEHQPLGSADRNVDDAALEELSRGADEDPAEAGEPGALVQRLEKPRRVALVQQQDVVMPSAAAGEGLLTLHVEEAARRAGALHSGGGIKARDQRAQHRRVPTQPLDLARNGTGHALHVAVEQHPPWTRRPGEILVRARQDRQIVGKAIGIVRPLLGRDDVALGYRLIGQAAEGKGLCAGHGVERGREGGRGVATVHPMALGHADHEATARPVRLRLAVLAQRDALGQDAAAQLPQSGQLGGDAAGHWRSTLKAAAATFLTFTRAPAASASRRSAARRICSTKLATIGLLVTVDGIDGITFVDHRRGSGSDPGATIVLDHRRGL